MNLRAGYNTIRLAKGSPYFVGGTGYAELDNITLQLDPAGGSARRSASSGATGPERRASCESPTPPCGQWSMRRDRPAG